MLAKTALTCKAALASKATLAYGSNQHFLEFSKDDYSGSAHVSSAVTFPLTARRKTRTAIMVDKRPQNPAPDSFFRYGAQAKSRCT